MIKIIFYSFIHFLVEDEKSIRGRFGTIFSLAIEKMMTEHVLVNIETGNQKDIQLLFEQFVNMLIFKKKIFYIQFHRLNQRWHGYVMNNVKMTKEEEFNLNNFLEQLKCMMELNIMFNVMMFDDIIGERCYFLIMKLKIRLIPFFIYFNLKFLKHS